MSVAAKTREDTASVTGEHKFFSGNRGNLCVEEFKRDSTVQVGEKRRMDTRDNRRERLQQIAESTNSAPRLASSLATPFPKRNEFPRTHCSLIVQEELGGRHQYSDQRFS